MSPLRLTVIVEWENVLLAEMWRSKAMLVALREQCGLLLQGDQEGEGVRERNAFLDRFVSPVELLVVYNDEEVDGSLIEPVIRDAIGDGDGLLSLELLAAFGCHYYEEKNYGFRRGSGDVVLLLDSDVIPEDEWLCELLGSFADPAVEVVGGNSYIETRTLMGKAFALMWTFPLRTKPGKAVLEPQDQFFANNVAFRKEITEKYSFPILEDTARGACTLLARQLRANGVGLFRNTGAQVEHPAPNGLSHYFIRAVAHGRDKVLGSDRSESLGVHLSRYCLDSLRWAWRRRKKVNLSLHEAPVVAVLILVYVATRALAIIATHARPEMMRAPRFRV